MFRSAKIKLYNLEKIYWTIPGDSALLDCSLYFKCLFEHQYLMYLAGHLAQYVAYLVRLLWLSRIRWVNLIWLPMPSLVNLHWLSSLS